MTKPLLNYCLVTQNLASIIEDSEYDSDRYPDVSDISGQVIFTPNIANGKAYQLFDSDGKTYTVPVSRIQAKIINGVITHEDETGVYLFAAGPGSNPDKITYSVEYRNLRSGDLSFSLSPLKFEAIPGGEVDLTMATPVVGATPSGIVRGPRGTSLETIVVDGSELVFTAVDDAHSFEMVRIPLEDVVRAEADAAANGVRDALSADLTTSQSARDAAEGHAKRAATSESNAKTSETNSKQSETNAGDYAEVATTAATEAVRAMERATDLAGGDFATHEYVDTAAADAVGTTTSYLGRSDNATANQLVRLNNEGKVIIATGSITGPYDPVNKTYVDAAIGVTTNHISYSDTRFANRIVRLDDKGKLFILTSSITGLNDPVNKQYVDNAILESGGGQTSWWN